ncbi:Bug family tripartite tricarboxylate transporter substrate binding protein [Ramlibacter humi]|uniref:Tripartite tricarboxylate transporter substrate binding protein n=1 Tax=Ramlibacter humi TaxID=2530451 RepID=A0A4Z0BFE7_9BURK|nr:tripartite tricarboxylate transporter substrate binding protein [Ramlibacter humi]TFY97183.1 tripartite tricarboxylate transporter substrate binding protein [Ramlibacter humi]
MRYLQRFLGHLLLGAAVLGSSCAMAQDFPSASRTITLVVPFSAGGTPDIVGRLVGNALRDRMGVPVIVDNKPGAGGNIGARYVASKPADGYTLLVVPMGTLSVNQWLYKSVPYSPEKDFTPVNNLVGVPNVLVVGQNSKVRSVKDLIAASKSQPQGLSYGSSGLGTSIHLCMELMKAQSGANLLHVPYKGSAEAVTDLLGGRLDVVCSNIPPVLPMVRDGRLQAIATTGKTRNPLMPNLPTVAEAGLPGFEAQAWIGIVGPAGLPADVQQKLSAALSQVLSDPKIAQQLTDLGLVVMNQGPKEFTQYIADESVRWKKVITAAGLLHHE